ncbi:MAG: hypothetical protein ACRCYU_10355 [Nocardioides sp.]
MITPEVADLGTRLAEVVARNAAGAIGSKVRAIRARKLDQDAMNELIELVNDLIADKNELIGISQTLEQEIVARRISDNDITYITTRLIPVVERVMSLTDDSNAVEVLEAVKSVVSVETLTIMQLVGFDFRRAVGEPLTTLVERLILNQVPEPDRGRTPKRR